MSFFLHNSHSDRFVFLSCFFMNFQFSYVYAWMSVSILVLFNSRFIQTQSCVYLCIFLSLLYEWMEEMIAENCLDINGCENKMLDYIEEKERMFCSMGIAMKMVTQNWLIRIISRNRSLHHLSYNYNMVESLFSFGESYKKGHVCVFVIITMKILHKSTKSIRRDKFALITLIKFMINQWFFLCVFLFFSLLILHDFSFSYCFKNHFSFMTTAYYGAPVCFYFLFILLIRLVDKTLLSRVFKFFFSFLLFYVPS